MGETQVLLNVVTIPYFHQMVIEQKDVIEIDLANSEKAVEGKSPKISLGEWSKLTQSELKITPHPQNRSLISILMWDKPRR